MVTWHKWAAAGAVLALVAGLLYVLSPSREDRIRQQFAILSENIGKAPGHNKLVTAANAKRLRPVFTETITIAAPAYDYHRELKAAELPPLVLTATAPYDELSLSFRDLAFAFPSQDLARVRATALVRGRHSGTEWIEDVQELDCRFRRIDEDWRLEAVTVVDVLQR